MLDKKWMVLAIFFIALVAISGVSAAEDTGDVAAIETDTQANTITNDIATDEIQDDALKASSDDESDDALTASNDEEILTGGSNCYVNSSYTGSEETGTEDQPYKSLDKALNAIGRKDGDIINIAAGNGYSGSYDIKNNLTFTYWGPGEVVFDANGEGRIFNVLAREINITGITFKNANVDDFGGAIYFEKGLINSHIGGDFINNHAGSGGAIFVNGNIEKSLISAYFADNSALMGGAIYAGSITYTEIDGDFFNNTAIFEMESLVEVDFGLGGAIFSEGVIENSSIEGEFTFNQATYSGGAIFVLEGIDRSNVTGGFMHNFALVGGAVDTPAIRNSNIAAKFVNNTALIGGAVNTNLINNTEIESYFINNTADLNLMELIDDNTKEDIEEYLNEYVDEKILEYILNYTMEHEMGLGFGGGITVAGIMANSTIFGEFINNGGADAGGAISVLGVVEESLISGDFELNHAGLGGSLFLPVVKDSKIAGGFSSNYAVQGGAIFAVFVNHTDITGDFHGNCALNNKDKIGADLLAWGGAICIVGNLENSIFAGDFVFNKANAGGAVFIYGLELFESENGIYNNIFDSNFIGNGAGLGAAILINGSSSQNKFNSNFISNVAVLDGIVYLFDSTEDSISGCLFMDNTAENSVLSIESSSGTNITNNIFLNSDRVYDIVVNGELLCLDNNWFGHNATNYKDSPKVDGYELNNWLFLNAVADPASVSYLGTTNIVFNLFVYDNSTKSSVGKYDHTLLEPVNLTIASTNGKVDKEIVTIGEAIKFSSNGKKGTVTAAIGDVQDTIEISCLPRLSGNNLVMDYLGNNYKIQVFDANGNPVAGETVKMTVNGVTYTVKSDKNGYATLPIKLKPKTYTITSKYKGFTLKNTIKVKNTLKTQKSFSVKKSAKKLVLKATLKWSNGKAIAGKKVSFKINGKSFFVKTDKNGNAKITFAVKVKNKTLKLTFNKKTAKVKIGKTYKIAVHYKNETASSKLVVKK